ncbi:MAG: hypothetical protein KDD31_11175 [Muricauda sp.]|nr:hypothetical protein [Allomuricauda sp.]
MVTMVSPLLFFAQVENADPSNLVGATTSDYASFTGSQYDQSVLNGSFGSLTNVQNLKYGDMLTRGDNLLYDNWENYGSLYVGDKVYRLSNVNFDVKLGQFMTQIQSDSLFIYNKYNIDSISVNQRMFKKFYDPAGNEKIVFAEVVYDANGVRILKNHYVKEVEGSPNPMINRPTNKLVKRSKYYTANDDTLVPMSLSKRNVLKQITDPKLAESAKNFAKENRLSFNSDEDVITILKYTFNQTE